MQATDVLSKLYAAHQEGKQTAGVDIEVSSSLWCLYVVDQFSSFLGELVNLAIFLGMCLFAARLLGSVTWC